MAHKRKFHNSLIPPVSRTRLISQFVTGVLAGGMILFFASFVIFANTLPQANKTPITLPADLPPADGIVVFTGTALERIQTGIQLLQADYAKRLLISGLYHHQGFDMLKSIAPNAYAAIKCCLDLDYRATNTRENAEETAAWAKVHGLESLIIVTSAHHVPRARLEMRNVNPRIHLSTYAVAPANVYFDTWWRYPGTFALLLGEYTRYLWTLAGLPNTG
ncbi:MAG: YdcF family protein [Alphaproteobacteria bacterium]|nr:YdcF family protein [Alphaproteobacteria bacterium]